MKKFFSSVILCFAISANSFALLPLIPLGFGVALVGTAAAGIALPLIGAAIVVGAAVALVTLASSSPSDPAAGPIKVQINPAEPLPTPNGWTPPVSPSVNPSPPASGGTASVGYRASSTGPCNFYSSTAQAHIQACIAIPTAFAAGTTVGTCITTDGGASYACPVRSPTGVTFDITEYRETNCPTGYTVSGTNCVLTSPSTVVKPSDGQCQIVRVGNTFSGDPQDPDCAVGNVPVTVSVTGTQVTVKPSNTQTDSVKINADGSTTITTTTINSGNNTTTTTTINVSPGTGVGTTKITGIGTTTVNGTGDQAGVGTSPSTQLPTDYNREATQQGIKADTAAIRAGQCGGTGQPKCSLDETGTPSPAGTYDGVKAQLEAKKQDKITGQGTATSSDGKDTGWGGFSFSLPSPSCSPIAYGTLGTFDVCPSLAILRNIMSWVWAMTTAWCCIGMVGSTIRSA